MNKKSGWLDLLKLLLLILVTGWLASRTTGTAVVAAASQEAVIRPDPLSLGLKPDAQGTVSIVIAEAQDLYGVEFHLTFDPNIVEVVDADASQPGIQIQPGDWLENTFVAVNRADNATGKIDYAVTLLNPAPPVSGSGSIGLITFKAKSNGVSPLKIEKAILATREAQEIQVAWQDGALGVSALGQAPEVNTPAKDNTALIAAAGFGMLAFLIALGVLVGAIRVRRRQTARALGATDAQTQQAESRKEN